MDNEYKKMIYAASHNRLASPLRSRGQNSSVISEDDKITLRLPPVRANASRLDYADGRQAAPHGLIESVSEIDLNSLSASDQILIETAQSVYVFTVVDPRALKGRLIGGILGNRLLDAYLIPSWLKGGHSKIDQKSIKTGAKVIFIIEAGKGCQRLTTSSVKSLLHRKEPRVVSPVNGKRRVTREHVSE